MVSLEVPIFERWDLLPFPLNIASNIPQKVMIETSTNEVVKKRQMQAKM